MALTYEQIKQKIAALNPRHSEVEALMREIFTANGQLIWDVDGNPVAVVNAITPVGITDDYTARPFDYISATASSVDITVALPAAADHAGKPIFVHKVDATAYKILTAVKDVAFQNSTMHLVSNGTDWVIS